MQQATRKEETATAAAAVHERDLCFMVCSFVQLSAVHRDSVRVAVVRGDKEAAVVQACGMHRTDTYIHTHTYLYIHTNDGD